MCSGSHLSPNYRASSFCCAPKGFAFSILAALRLAICTFAACNCPIIRLIPLNLFDCCPTMLCTLIWLRSTGWQINGATSSGRERSDNSNNHSQKKLLSLLWAKSSLASHKSISKCSAQNEINTQTQFHRFGRAFFYIILINCLL